MLSKEDKLYLLSQSLVSTMIANKELIEIVLALVSYFGGGCWQTPWCVT